MSSMASRLIVESAHQHALQLEDVTSVTDMIELDTATGYQFVVTMNGRDVLLQVEDL